MCSTCRVSCILSLPQPSCISLLKSACDSMPKRCILRSHVDLTCFVLRYFSRVPLRDERCNTQCCGRGRSSSVGAPGEWSILLHLATCFHQKCTSKSLSSQIILVTRCLPGCFAPFFHLCKCPGRAQPVEENFQRLQSRKENELSTSS